ncbi:MAG: transposase [bacterium]
MPTPRISTEATDSIYYLTFTVRRWYYLFDRHQRWDVLLQSLKYCQEHKGLQVFAWVFMLNHIHLLIKSSDVSGFIRDFKRHTSKELKKNIEATEPNALKLFEYGGEYHFWESDNMPIRIESEKFFLQKLKYIIENPVKKGYVREPEHWVYSSANLELLLRVDVLA